MANIIASWAEIVNGGYKLQLVGNDVDGYAIATTADGGGNPLPSTSGKAEDDILTLDAGLAPQWVTPSGGGKQQMQTSVGITGAFAANTSYYIPINTGILPSTWDAEVGQNNDGSLPTNGGTMYATYFKIVGAVKNFYFIGNDPGIAHTFIVTLYKNGVATAATFQVAHSDVDGNGNAVKGNAVNSIAVAAGDLFTYRVVTSIGSNPFAGTLVCEFDPS